MLNKFNEIKNKYLNFNIYELNNIIVIVCFVLFLISIIYVKNIYLIILMYLCILYFARNYDKKIVKFLSSILPIVIFGYFLIKFVNLNFYEKEIMNIFNIVIKVLMILDCFFVLIYYFKTKKIKLLNLLKRKHKKYTFKELRRKNLEKFRNDYHNYLDNYLEKNKISLGSDYFKVIENNIDNKVNNNLDEFVWTNYLRFYKNQKYNNKLGFSVFNLFFLLINVIILILVLNVR